MRLATLLFGLAAFLSAGTAHAADELILGKKLLIKNPPAGAAGNKVVHLGKDPNITIGAAGSAGDPQCSGAGGGGASSLRIAASGGAGDVTIPLACGNWTTNGSNSLYKYKDTTGATCKLVLVKSGVLVKAVCKGPQMAIDLNGTMSPVAVVTTLNTQRYCTEFGGTAAKDGSDDKTFLRKDAVAPAACAAPPPPKLVFVTSTAFNGNLGGLSGADAKCNTHASAAGLPGTYKAWLSDGSDSPSSRFTHATVPYVRVLDSVVIANDWTDLTDGSLAAAITRAENGLAPSEPYVWTNTNPDGTVRNASTSCDGWTSDTSSFQGWAGEWGYQTSTWTDSFGNSCSDTFFCLYCFQQ